MEAKYYPIPKALQKDVSFFGLRAKYVDQAFKGISIFLVLGMFLGAFTSVIVGFVVSLTVASAYFLLMLYYSLVFGENGHIKSKADRARPHSVKGSVNKKNLVLWL